MIFSTASAGSHPTSGSIPCSTHIRKWSSSTASGSATLRTNRAGTAHAFIVGFNTIVADGVTLSNAWRGADSWHHGILPLEQPMQVDRDTPIRIELSTDDGRQWNWTGEIAGTPFAQTNVLTQLSSLPLRQ